MADLQPQYDLNVSDVLASSGLKLVGREGDNFVVEGGDGKQFNFNPQDFISSQGIDTKQVNVEINSPTTAIPQSPVGLFDRVKLSLGNDAGSVNYLKKKFEDAQYVSGQGLVVKDKGAWHKVDPTMFKDPWSASEAIADTVEFVSGGILPAVGAGVAAAAALPSGPGSVAAAGAGGAAGKAVQSSILGRLVGTYQPKDATDELEDIGLEGLYAAAGQAIALGAKPAWEGFKNAMKKIGGVASEGTKDALAATLGRTTAAGSEATRYMFDNADEVSQTIKSLRPMSQGTDDLISQAASHQVDAATSWLETAKKALPQKFGQLLDHLGSAADEAGLKVNVGQAIQSSMGEFESQGFGKIVKGELVPFTQEEVASRMAQGLPVQGVSDEVFSRVKDVFSAVNKFSKVGELEGANAARSLAHINKTLNGAFAEGAEPVVQRAQSTVMSAIKNQFSDAFEQAGLENEWAGMNTLYQRYGDAVSTARKLLAADGGPERFYQSLFSGAGKKATIKGEADLLEELAGATGTAARDRIMNLEAAKRFAPLLPKFGLSQAAATGAGSLGLVTGSVSAPVALGAAATFSPRTVLGATRGYQALSSGTSKYAMTFVNALKTLPPASLKKALADPNIIRAAAQETIKSMVESQQNTQDILSQNGIGQ